MEDRPPDEAVNSLESLTKLSLCIDWHQRQVPTVVSKWYNAIYDATNKYDKVRELEEEVRVLEKKLENEDRV